MTDETASERRLAENEVIFRQLNEKVIEGVKETNRLALEDNQPEYMIKKTGDYGPLHFYCECSDENCRLRLPIDYKTYEKIHAQRNQFIVAPGHDTKTVENVISKTPRYWIIRKQVLPPETGKTLHPTTIDNS